jgi:hypothetical protein
MDPYTRWTERRRSSAAGIPYLNKTPVTDGTITGNAPTVSRRIYTSGSAGYGAPQTGKTGNAMAGYCALLREARHARLVGVLFISLSRPWQRDRAMTNRSEKYSRILRRLSGCCAVGDSPSLASCQCDSCPCSACQISLRRDPALVTPKCWGSGQKVSSVTGIAGWWVLRPHTLDLLAQHDVEDCGLAALNGAHGIPDRIR